MTITFERNHKLSTGIYNACIVKKKILIILWIIALLFYIYFETENVTIDDRIASPKNIISVKWINVNQYLWDATCKYIE